ncbi:HAD-IIA family hydrolase [Leisingera methylohalidivorans]|uniref:HAD family hydrolase n=1 Tax=Leisingera methylohalidivorans DSM 14336 TaxID=999552 RepID=V9VXL1_9RHOB|nr:HAD-IIA family hydrolase [Leisingera methylohalidivorans]AHD02115.1 HAD family hydrolase [Leisingera methylohalidivorans DSM 14336]
MISTNWAFDTYESLRADLPRADFPQEMRSGHDLGDTAQDYDAYVLDAFGVLNRGETAIPGAVERMAALREQGKRLVVLTNAASYRRADILAKYHRLGFDFAPSEVVSSRDVAFSALPKLPDGKVWAAAAADGDDFSDAPEAARIAKLADDPGLLRTAGGFLLLSSERWSETETAALTDALLRDPRPLIVANPDLVAPREKGLTVEPGLIAHRITGRTGVKAVFFGKPFGNAFEAALARLDGIPLHRIAMVGDTLHTDVLGGAAAGIGTILITDNGLFRGHEIAPYITRCAIRPNWIIATT